MSYVKSQKAINAYGESSAKSESGYASQHRLVQILMENFLTRVSVAKGQISRDDFAGKSEQISTAISIITALKASLDIEAGGEIATNLDDLYGYINNRLLEANINNDVTALDESASLIGQIKSAWDAMPEDIKIGKT